MPENTAEQLPQLDNVRDNATQEDFKMKNKVYEMLLYAYPALEQFPKSDRKTCGPYTGSNTASV